MSSRYVITVSVASQDGSDRVEVAKTYRHGTDVNAFDFVKDNCVLPALRQTGLYYDWEWDTDYSRYKRYDPIKEEWEWQEVQEVREDSCCVVM
jgi:hypothetical protein